MAKSSLEPVGSVLQRVLAAAAERTQQGQFLTAIWNECVGEALSKHTRPGVWTHGTLFVEVDGPQWGQTLSQIEKEVVAKLNAKISPRRCKALRIEVVPR